MPGRKATSCSRVGNRPPYMWCDACKNPKLKAKCMTPALDLADDHRAKVPATASSSSTTSAPGWTTIDTDSDEESAEVFLLPARDCRCAADVPGAPAANGMHRDLRNAAPRERKQPRRFEPEEFWRRELPEVAKDSGTQLQRAAARAKQRGDELEAMQAEWLKKGRAHAEELVSVIQSKLEKTASDLAAEKAARKKEAAAAFAYRRQQEANNRQKAITHFFMPQGIRPCEAPAASLGEGYTERNVSSKTFSHHVTIIEKRILELSHGDPLKQLQLAAAINQRMHGIRDLRDKDHEAWSYVRNSLKAFFEVLRDRYHGRYPNHVRAAQQAVCAAIANAAPPRKLHLISEAVGASIVRLSEGRKHWSEWVSGDRQSIMDVRGKIRCDGIPEEWVEFAVDIWKNNTRRSERAKDSVRNPRDKSDKVLYRIHWLEMRIQDIQEIIVREGKRKFDRPAVEATPANNGNCSIDAAEAVEFHFSWWYTKKVRPFFVKDAGRDVCVCVYHLRFDIFVETLYNYTKRLRGDLKLCKCQHASHMNPIDFRRAHTCARSSECERYDKVPCVQNTCTTCKDLNLFKLCECEARENLPPIKCQIWEKVDYTLKDGSIKQKSDFVPHVMPYSQWEALLRAYWPKFMLHHDVGKWQDDETTYLKSHIERGTTFEIQDFGENYHIERKREHQTFYFCEIGVSLYGCMLRIRVEDLSDAYLGPGEKLKLLHFFEKLNKPPIVLIAHIIISEDLSHDNAFVQHVNSRIIGEWLRSVVAPGVVIRQRILCTDGAPSQFKLADQILWVSKQGGPNSDTPKVRHIFRGTAHGKDDSDPELGHHKNAADRYQLRAVSCRDQIYSMVPAEGEVAMIFTPHDFFLFASTQMRMLQRDFYSRKGVGIFRREFHWIPNHGHESINRRIPGCNRLGDVGIKKLHFFESIGRPGYVGIRERSCHQCVGACAIGQFASCKHIERCGSYRVLQLNPKTAVPRISTRTHRENGALEFAERSKPGDFFVSDHVSLSSEKFVMLAVAKDSTFREADEAIEADEAGRFKVSIGDFVIDAVRFSCVSAGGTVFTPAMGKSEYVVPTHAILAFDLDMAPVDTSRCSARVQSGRVEKWQLSSEDHARVLRLLSETVDTVVANAVHNVSGRS